MYKLIRNTTFWILFPVVFATAVAYRKEINVKEWRRVYCDNYDLSYMMHSTYNWRK